LSNSIKTNKERIKQQLNELWQYAQKMAVQEIDDMFFDKKDPMGFGYVGDYYGNWYWYSYNRFSVSTWYYRI
jgi:hypothetical protein